jgi:hypothetical protein
VGNEVVQDVLPPGAPARGTVARAEERALLGEAEQRAAVWYRVLEDSETFGTTPAHLTVPPAESA